MEGLPTKISKKKTLPRKKPQWILSMTIGERSTLVPKVTLCSESTNAEMAIIDTTPTDMIISFQVFYTIFFLISFATMHLKNTLC